MVETILDFVLKLVVLGLVFYVVNRVFSKKTKNFHMTINHNGLEVDSSFYKE